MRRQTLMMALGIVLSAATVLTITDTPSDPSKVELLAATPVRLPGNADSNSPSLWDLVDGKRTLVVLTSVAGRPSRARGDGMTSMSKSAPVVVTPWPGGGVWMEAVVEASDGTWYGYYHNENVAAAECGTKTKKVIPRIGAARSIDHGATWQPLGIILEAPPKTYNCSTKNTFFVGGLGDLSVMLSPNGQDLYIFYSEYMKSATTQGVAVARLAWADRDRPVGKVMVWRTRTWFPATLSGSDWTYPAGLPIFPAAQPWHDGDTVVDAFWGPSVHWNTYLNEYVMLLNHSKDESFHQEGIYISYAPRLDDPRLWTAPVKIVDGGSWYPQVMGMGADGTDKVAGQTARFFMGGASQSVIHFER